MKTLHIIIPGKPIAKRRPRFSRRGTYSDQGEEKRRFQQYAFMQIPKNHTRAALSVKYTFFMPRPISHYGSGKNNGTLRKSAPKYHTKKPDLDNLEKFASDCLTGLVWKDDSQIVRSITEKRYSKDPRTEIRITELED